MQMDIVAIDKLTRELQQKTDLAELADIDTKLEAIRQYARKSKDSFSLLMKAAEARARIVRRMGQLFKEIEREEGRGDRGEDGKFHQKSQPVTSGIRQAEQEANISRMTRIRYEQISQLPDEEFEAQIGKCWEQEREITLACILSAFHKWLHSLQDWTNPEGKFRVIYADPPWRYGNTMPTFSRKGDFGDQRDHYRLMNSHEVAALPVKEIVADNAVLFLWVTSPVLEESFDVINAWGFNYKASFVWDKVKHNMGHYNSVRHEFLLVATRGSCMPDEKKLYDSVQSIERTEHSEKPEKFREIIDTLYPNGARVELFSRKQIEGWIVHGDEIPR